MHIDSGYNGLAIKVEPFIFHFLLRGFDQVESRPGHSPSITEISRTGKLGCSAGTETIIARIKNENDAQWHSRRIPLTVAMMRTQTN